MIAPHSGRDAGVVGRSHRFLARTSSCRARGERTLLALVLAALVACTPAEDPEGTASEEPGAASTMATGDAPQAIPEPDMEDMEPQVAKRLREVRSAVVREPDSADAWGRLGMVCHAHELWDCATVSYRRARTLDPSAERWSYYLGDVLSVLGTDLDAAEQAFRRTMELRPDYAPTHLRLGRVMMAKNQPEAAAAQFERALVLAPDLQPARLSLAQIRLAEGELDTAAEMLETILTEQPRHEQALSALGRVYMLQGKRDEARKIAERARQAAEFNLYTDPLMGKVELEGISSVLLWNRARAFFDAGDFEQAARGLSRVVEVLQDNADAHHQLAVSYQNLGRSDRAVPHLERVVELDPDRVDPQVLLASIHLDQQRPQEALTLLRRALELAPDDPHAPWLLGRAQVLTGELRKGIETFEAARRAAPKEEVPPWVHNEWGSALAQTGRLDAALEHFDAALRADPDNAQALFYLGLVHEGSGRLERAVDSYCRSMAAQPNPPAAGRLQALGRSCH